MIVENRIESVPNSIPERRVVTGQSLYNLSKIFGRTSLHVFIYIRCLHPCSRFKNPDSQTMLIEEISSYVTFCRNLHTLLRNFCGLQSDDRNKEY